MIAKNAERKIPTETGNVHRRVSCRYGAGITVDGRGAGCNWKTGKWDFGKTSKAGARSRSAGPFE